MGSISGKILGTLGCLLISSTSVIATETNRQNPVSQDLAQSQEFTNPQVQYFWENAAKLVQDQLNILHRIELALNSAKIQEVQRARSNLFVYQTKVYDFLRSQYNYPQNLCYQNLLNPSNNHQLNSTQEQVYCTLYQTNQQLTALLPILDQRIAELTDFQSFNTLPTQQRPFPNESSIIPQSNLSINPTPIPIIGKPIKTAVENPQVSLNPSLAPSQEVLYLLNNNQQILLSLTSVFPGQIQFTDPKTLTEMIEQDTYNLSAKEIAIYQDFLQQSNRGVSLIFTPQNYYPAPHQLQNRLIPSIPLRFPFPPLKAEQEEYTPRLTLQVNNDLLEIAMGTLNYGFMVNIGDVPLEKLTAKLDDLDQLSDEAKAFLLTYTPPNELEAIQLDQRRFLTGKTGLGTDQALTFPVFSQLPLQLNQTYIVRLIQYQIPEIIITGQPISRQERFQLKEMLKLHSSDLLVAIRPVRQRIDGNYVMLWQILGEFPAPQIRDLENYVVLE